MCYFEVRLEGRDRLREKFDGLAGVGLEIVKQLPPWVPEGQLGRVSSKTN